MGKDIVSGRITESDKNEFKKNKYKNQINK